MKFHYYQAHFIAALHDHQRVISVLIVDFEASRIGKNHIMKLPAATALLNILLEKKLGAMLNTFIYREMS